MATALYEELNRTWKTTTKAFFGEELGELPDETYQTIRASIVQHIADEMLKQGKDKPEANDAAEEDTSINEVKDKTEATNAPAEAKA